MKTLKELNSRVKGKQLYIMTSAGWYIKAGKGEVRRMLRTMKRWEVISKIETIYGVWIEVRYNAGTGDTNRTK